MMIEIQFVRGVSDKKYVFGIICQMVSDIPTVSSNNPMMVASLVTQPELYPCMRHHV